MGLKQSILTADTGHIYTRLRGKKNDEPNQLLVSFCYRWSIIRSHCLRPFFCK